MDVNRNFHQPDESAVITDTNSIKFYKLFSTKFSLVKILVLDGYFLKARIPITNKYVLIFVNNRWDRKEWVVGMYQ